ncbi:MAG: hypothetical protein JXA15_10995 [Spirochaetales bacterium]|nr:hypothetical protein [Spirochaetales bacterium]
MNRPSFRAIAVLAVALAASAAFAQESGDPTVDSGTFRTNPYESGDALLSFRLGAGFGLLNLDLSEGSFDELNLGPGAAFSLSYMHFVARGFALGGELGGLVAGSIAGRTFFAAPLVFRASWHFVLSPFEIVPSVAAGATLQRLGELSHVDPIVRLGADWLWRQSADWGLGLRTELWLIPQFYLDYPDSNRLGGFLETTLTATYHL